VTLGALTVIVPALNHPTAISQKVEVIVEHFRRHVVTELGGHAKAMIVTGSREHALRYYFGVRDYITAGLQRREASCGVFRRAGT
jgi:hypothetical protein